MMKVINNQLYYTQFISTKFTFPYKQKWKKNTVHPFFPKQ